VLGVEQPRSARPLYIPLDLIDLRHWDRIPRRGARTYTPSVPVRRRRRRHRPRARTARYAPLLYGTHRRGLHACGRCWRRGAVRGPRSISTCSTPDYSCVHESCCLSVRVSVPLDWIGPTPRSRERRRRILPIIMPLFNSLLAYICMAARFCRDEHWEKSKIVQRLETFVGSG
jgi:hypothetical protein